VATDRDDRRLAASGDLELIRDFINTLDVLPDTGKIGDPASLASWLAEHGLVPTQPTLTEEDLEHARSRREALRGLLLANAGFPLAPEAAEAFDDAVGSARFLVRANEAGRLELLPTDAGELEDAVGGLASIVLAAQQGETWPQGPTSLQARVYTGSKHGRLRFRGLARSLSLPSCSQCPSVCELQLPA
jgi:hypothetical protein